MYLGYGGTMSIETPFPYSYTAKALIAELGIDVSSYTRHENRQLYQGLSEGVFFDREHFGADRIVKGINERQWNDFFTEAPLSAAVRADLIRLHTAKVDYLPDLSPEEKVHALQHMSYQDFLLKHAQLLPESLPFFAGVEFRNNMRVDTCPAYTAARSGAVGFDGMQLPGEPVFHSDYEFHFPDGNATIARLLVSRLVPGVFPGPAGSGINCRRPGKLRAARSTVSFNTYPAQKHRGKNRALRRPGTFTRSQGRLHSRRQDYAVRGGNAILACFNNMIQVSGAEHCPRMRTSPGVCFKSPHAIHQRTGAQLGTVAQTRLTSNFGS